MKLPTDYRPSENEEFMNPLQKEYFRQKLLNWRTALLAEANMTLENLAEQGGYNAPDLIDRSAAETDRVFEFRARSRARKLISKIDEALMRIKDGSYGFCEETGEPISLKRLEARPVATLCIEAQERHERHEKMHREEE
ncbi:RNA polymerase-binding protein DksA [Acetobacteraceae bacterium]|nr:RNA polymerase-binding protein DksA [Acetobacteraceae bacterium]